MPLCFILVPVPPTSPVDVVFIMDSSGSIGKDNFDQLEKVFVKMVSGRIGISPIQSRAALVLYGDLFSIQAPFDRYAITEDFWRAVDKLPYSGGQTRLDKSIAMAASNILPHARPGMDQIVIILTDGHQSYSPNAIGLKEASEPLKKDGIRILAVGIGSDVDINKLNLLVESKEDMVIIDHPADLIPKVESIVQAIGGKK